MSTIPICKPFFGLEEMEAIQQPLATGWVAQGPFVRKFEEQFSRFTGATHSVATSSCSTALHIAVAAMGLKPGDEVIVPAFTWIATPNAIEYMGATPVFCDIELPTFNIDVTRAESLITANTVGIMPVHLFGLCADMDAVMALAKKHGLWVIEDAACAFGAYYKSTHAGTFGEIGCFSFHPRKSITTGEGGMITTSSDRWGDLARILRDHGAQQTARSGFQLAEYEHLGYNFRMTDLQGALGCAQIERAEWILGRRSSLARRYNGMLADCDWLVLPQEPVGSVHSYQAYVCLFRPGEQVKDIRRLSGERNRVMAHLNSRGIATRPGTHAPVFTKYYREKYALRPDEFPNSHQAENLSFALPLYPQMREEDQHRVVTELLSCKRR